MSAAGIGRRVACLVLAGAVWASAMRTARAQEDFLGDVNLTENSPDRKRSQVAFAFAADFPNFSMFPLLDAAAPITRLVDLDLRLQMPLLQDGTRFPRSYLAEAALTLFFADSLVDGRITLTPQGRINRTLLLPGSARLRVGLHGGVRLTGSRATTAATASAPSEEHTDQTVQLLLGLRGTRRQAIAGSVRDTAVNVEGDRVERRFEYLSIDLVYLLSSPPQPDTTGTGSKAKSPGHLGAKFVLSQGFYGSGAPGFFYGYEGGILPGLATSSTSTLRETSLYLLGFVGVGFQPQ